MRPLEFCYIQNLLVSKVRDQTFGAAKNNFWGKNE